MTSLYEARAEILAKLKRTDWDRNDGSLMMALSAINAAIRELRPLNGG